MQRKDDLFRKEFALLFQSQRAFIFLYDTPDHLQLILCRTVCLLFRRAQRTDDIHHHKALPHADQQVDDPALRAGGLHCAFHSMVQRIGKQRVQIPCLDKAKTTAVCHGIQLDPPGLAQQALLGQHHIQHLVAGVAVRIIKAGCALGLLDALRRHRFRRQLAEIGDLHLQVMAGLIDDLHILPGNLILLTLALVQQVQSIEKIKKRNLNYAAMRADGELPREEYQALCKQAADEIAHLEQELKAIFPAPDPQTVSSDMKEIHDFLSQKFDVHGARLAPELIDRFVEVVTPIADYSYRWKLNTGCKKSKEERADLMAVSEKPILTFTIDFETAKRYREANKMPHQFRRAAWTDLTVEVYL